MSLGEIKKIRKATMKKERLFSVRIRKKEDEFSVKGALSDDFLQLDQKSRITTIEDEVFLDKKRKLEAQRKRELEEQAIRELEEQARRELEEQARRELEEQARRELEEKARRELEEKARRDLEENSKRRDFCERLNKHLEELQKRESEEQARRELEERVRRDLEEKNKRRCFCERLNMHLEKLQKGELEGKARRDFEEKSKRRCFCERLNMHLEKLQKSTASEQRNNVTDDHRNREIEYSRYVSKKQDSEDQNRREQLREKQRMAFEQSQHCPASEQRHQDSRSKCLSFKMNKSCTPCEGRKSCPIHHQSHCSRKSNNNVSEKRDNSPSSEQRHKETRSRCPGCTQKTINTSSEGGRNCQTICQSLSTRQHKITLQDQQNRLEQQQRDKHSQSEDHRFERKSSSTKEQKSQKKPITNTSQIYSSNSLNRAAGNLSIYSRSIKNIDNTLRSYTRKNAKNKSRNIGEHKLCHNLESPEARATRELFSTLIKIKDLRPDSDIYEEEESFNIDNIKKETKFSTQIEYRSYKTAEKYGNSLSGGMACLSQKLRKPRTSIVSSKK